VELLALSDLAVMVHSKCKEFIYLLIYGIFKNDVSISEHAASKRGQSVKNNFKRLGQQQTRLNFRYNVGIDCED